MNRTISTLKGVMFITFVAGALSACNTVSRLSEIGDGPKLTEITNPTVMPDYRPVSMPMPMPVVERDNPNSLWRPGARAFFKDNRAKEVGDILTVSLALADSAVLANKTARTRADSESANITNLLGFETKLAKNNLPRDFSPTAAGNFGNDHSTSGDGTIDRKETISLTFAAVVTQILPNGALVILGRQELLVNSDMRELELTGVVRPGDIDADNSVPHTRIAEMRVAYGGRGTLSNLQQPRWGTQLWDTLFPF